jgi:hypothetical protein
MSSGEFGEAQAWLQVLRLARCRAMPDGTMLNLSNSIAFGSVKKDFGSANLRFSSVVRAARSLAVSLKPDS